MSGVTKLMTAGGGGVSLTPASSIASDVTVNVPSVNGDVVLTNVAGTLGLAATGGNIITASTNGTERMRIDSSGNVLVGTTSLLNDAKFNVTNTGNTTGTFYQGDLNYAAGVFVNAGSSGTRYLCAFRSSSGGSNLGAITHNGTTVTYATSSDYRLKENIAPMTGALDKVSALKPVTYTWKSTGENSQGFIAHELQAVVPDCVTGEKDAVDKDGKPVYQGIDTSFLVATLTKAIQELKQELDDAKTRITQLEAY